MDEITLKTLCGEHLFSGIKMSVEKHYSTYQEDDVDCNVCLFTFDGTTYKVLENPDDGYRSYCGCIEETEQEPMYRFPETKVVCYMDESESNEVLIVRDAFTGKVVLEIGTKNLDDYYPYCHFAYIPENMACNSERRNQT